MHDLLSKDFLKQSMDAFLLRITIRFAVMMVVFVSATALMGVYLID